MYKNLECAVPDILIEYSQYLRVIKNRSVRTIEQYQNDLVLFLCFLKAKFDGLSTEPEDYIKVDISQIDATFLNKVRSEHVYSFLSYVADKRGNKASARARKLTAIKSFFKYLTVTTRQLKDNPSKDIDAPSQRAPLPKFLSLDESIELLQAVKNDTESKTKERDFAILTLFLNCGMRLSELVGLNLSDFDKELTVVRVLGKGSKERMIYLNNACKSAIEDYIPIRNSDAQIKDKNALFISSRQHNRISNKTVQWLVKKYLELAGLGNKHYSTHKLRHTAATLMYRTGKVDVRVLKDILGHEQLNTTQIYTHVSDESMRSAMMENPLSEMKIEGSKIED
ncbi:MAG: tyrosine recombinase XerC [Clostridia bacterium]|nr:tyrosine recombinase XerC [Clostridia bacterium]